MSAPTSRRQEGGADLELGLFVLEAALLVASIVLVVHFRSTTATVFAVGAIVVAVTVAAVRLRGATGRRSGLRSARLPYREPRQGDYRASSRDLFRIERIFEDRVLVEDCRTGVLVDVDREELAALRIVDPGPADRAAPARSAG